jgi:hypothetical protein
MVMLLAGAPFAVASSSAQGSVGAGTGSAGGPQYTHRMTEKAPISAALCAQFKAAVPTQANNPDLCFFTHGAEWTDVQPLPAGAVASQASTGKAAPGMAAALSCPSGNVSYHDWFESISLRWDFELVTTFAWYGDCAPPSLTRLVCYIGYLLSTDVSNSRCYQYTYPATNPNRRAAVYSQTVVEHWGIFSYTYDLGQRRECFNTGSSSCYWTSWTGIP